MSDSGGGRAIEDVLALRERIAQMEAEREELRRSQTRYRALLDAVPDLVIRLRTEGTYVDFIEAKDIGLLVTTAERLGKNVRDILPAEIAERYLHAVRRAVETGETQTIDYRLTVRGHTADYEARVVRSSADEAILVVRDVSARRQAEEALRVEKDRSEQLLQNILPRAIVIQLRERPDLIAERFDHVSILFADIVGFTEFASQFSPLELVRLLNEIFSRFDRLADQNGLEKIKTIGDAYMAVSGLPTPRPDHAEAAAEMALCMQDEITRLRFDGFGAEAPVRMRIGIHSGPVVAGVIGVRKFIYDLWGDAVNVASRMESHGLPGCVQVSEDTYRLLADRYVLTERGVLPIKGKGQMRTYFLQGRRPAPPAS